MYQDAERRSGEPTQTAPKRGQADSSVNLLEYLGVPGGIRTHDPRIRNPVLYPAELRGPSRPPALHLFRPGVIMAR